MMHISNITNEKIDDINFEDNFRNNIIDILVFAVGYEERSIFLYEKYFKGKNIIPLSFLFNDYENYPTARSNLDVITGDNIDTITVGYNENKEVFEKIKEKISPIRGRKKINIHFDYSSMPRSWYCHFASNIDDITTDNCKFYFWYSQGDYQQEIESWPSAGIEDFSVFSGRASLRAINERSHIIGVGFDSLRTLAISSVLDPSYLVITLSHVQGDTTMRNKVSKVNQELINSSAYSVTLPIDNFVFSISKLYETVKELLPKGDVILAPDGPKPQVLVSSILPKFFNELGVICLHVKRHASIYEAIPVKPTGEVFGFSYDNNSE